MTNTAIIPAAKFTKQPLKHNPFYLLHHLHRNNWACVNLIDMTLDWNGMAVKADGNDIYVLSPDKKVVVMHTTPTATTVYLDSPKVTSLTVDSIAVDTADTAKVSYHLVNRALSSVSSHLAISEGDGILRCTVITTTTGYSNPEPAGYMDSMLKINYTPPLVTAEGKYNWELSQAEFETDLVDASGEAGVRYRKLDMKIVRKAREEFNLSMAGFHTMYTMGVFKGAWPTPAEWLTASKLNFDGIVAREPFWWMKLIAMDPNIQTRNTQDGKRIYLSIYWRGEEYPFTGNPQKYIDRLWRDNKEMVYELVGAERPEVTSIEEYDNRGKKE